jgi:hypothetical protein
MIVLHHLDFSRASRLLAVAERTGLLENHPEVGAYLARLKANDDYRKAVQIGGPMMPE